MGRYCAAPREHRGAWWVESTDKGPFVWFDWRTKRLRPSKYATCQCSACPPGTRWSTSNRDLVATLPTTNPAYPPLDKP